MPQSIDHHTYQSPFSWRYGSAEMRAVWSEMARRRLWRRIWVALAEAQAEAGLVDAEQVADLRAHQDDINLDRALQIEAEIGHDVMAEVRAYAEQCPAGGGIIHWGATSADITDNADVLRQRQALTLIRARLRSTLEALSAQIDQYADLPCMAYTHLQPAEPTTIGYRLALYAQDLWNDLRDLDYLAGSLRGKGLKGAVGTGASYGQALEGTGLTAMTLEAAVMRRLDLPAVDVAGQTYPRTQDLRLLHLLAGVAASLSKFAFDLRLLQSPAFGEWREPFQEKQVGSSAMPFKRNPVHSEKIDSLARYVAGLVDPIWQNAANSLLERTLDDSANRRSAIPEAFLAVDEMLLTAVRLIRGLNVDAGACRRNLERYGPFAATERVLMALVRAGASRQEMHERLREHSLNAWQSVQAGEVNPLPSLVAADPAITAFLPTAEMERLMDASGYVGDAPERARKLARELRAM